MEASLDQAPCLYFSSSEDGLIVHCNQMLCKKLGYVREELIGQKLETILTTATRIFQQTHFFPLLKMQGFAEEIFITLQSKSKEHVPVLINAEKKTVDERNLFVFTGIIVHNRKKFEDELVAAKKAAETALKENTQLQHTKLELHKNIERLDYEMSITSRRNEELLQFNKVVTHDLQEPLRKLFVFSTMMLENGDRDINLKSLQRVKSSAEQMRSILSGLQQYVWLTDIELKKTTVNLTGLLLLVKSELEQQQPDVRINLEVEELSSVEADHEQMRFLINELLSNAIRFRKPDEEVFIRVSTDSLLRNQFKHIRGKYKYSEYVRLQISDKGLGLDGAYSEQVFELFKRFHSVSGRGVGLALCKKIVENHHGIISFDGEKGIGTTVSIYLPYLTSQPSAVDNKRETQQMES